MNKKNLWVIGSFAGFIVLALLVATVGRDLLPKVSYVSLTITDCQFTPQRVELDKDQTVTLAVDSDVSGTLEINNYDIALPLTAGEPDEVSFRTVRSGAFDAVLSGCSEHTTILVRDDSGQLPDISDHHHD